MENLKHYAVIARFVGGYEQEAIILETDKNERELLKEYGPSISYLGRFNDRKGAEFVKNRVESRSKQLTERLRRIKANA